MPLPFYKYENDPTVYGSKPNAQGGDDAIKFGSEDEFFAAGGARDFSNVEVRKAPVAAPDADAVLARQAGQAGLGVDDLTKLLGKPVPAGSEDKIRSDLGIPGLEDQVFKPAPSTEKLFNDAYAAAGLTDIKKRREAVAASLKAKKDELNKRMLAVNENPWMSEASRLTNITNTKNFFNGDISNLIDEDTALETEYTNTLNEINNLVSRHSTDYATQSGVDTAKLNYLVAKADKQMAALEKAESSKVARYLPEYLQAKIKATKPDTVETNDGAVLRWDTNLGQFVEVRGAIPKDPLDRLKKELEVEKLVRDLNGEDESWRKEILSAADAKALGVTYGTTKGQAADAGIVPSTPLSAEAQKLAGNVKSATSALGKMKQELFGVADPNTPIDQLNNVRSNILTRAALPFSMAGTYTAAEKELKDVLVRMRTGAAISENEEKYYSSQMPRVQDNEATIKYKLKVLEDLFNNILPSKMQQMSETESLFEQFEGGPTSLKGPASGKTPYLNTLGSITGPNGSPVWKYGLDVDLKKGDPVKSPVNGKVLATARTTNGFGLQVKIRGEDGKEIWLSHLDGFNVKAGDTVRAGQVVGKGGNTGKVIAVGGGDGSHLDITMPKPGGGYYSAPEVHKYLKNKFV